MRTRWLSILLMLVLVSCEADFDIIRDTDQRTVSVVLQTHELLTNILAKTDGGYVKGEVTSLTSEQLLRVTGYCYDSRGILRAQQTLLAADLSDLTLRFKHLKRDNEYDLVFVADIVRTDEHVGYVEQSYQLGTLEWSSFFLINNEHLTDPVLTALYSTRTKLIPVNQTDTLTLKPLTQNGFIRFVNFNEPNDTHVRVYICDKYLLKSNTSEVSYGYDYTISPESATIPLTNINANGLSLCLYRQLTARTYDTLYMNIYPPRRPFVVDIDMNRFSEDDINITAY